MKNINNYKEYLESVHLNEQSDADKLYTKITDAIDSIDDSMSYKNFAEAVAIVLEQDYGKHLYDAFIKHLKSKL